MIDLIRRKGYQIDAYGYGNTSAILSYGTRYSSRTSNKDEGKRNSFILLFKSVVVHIDSIDMKYPLESIFPMSWFLQVSNDNRTWTNITMINDQFCDKTYNYDSSKLYCSEEQEKRFDAQEYVGYNSFVKFVLIKNSILRNDTWIDKVSFNGFDINGNYHLKIKTVHSWKYMSIFGLYYFVIFL